MYEQGGRILGYIRVKEEGGQGYVHMLYVDPDATRRGIGHKLLATGLDWLKTKYRQVLLRVEDSNLRAIAFYAKEGFNKLSDQPVPFVIGDGQEHMVYEMTREL